MSNEVGIRRSSEITPSVMHTSRRGYPYTDVHVLLIYWEDGNNDFYEQLQKLGKKLKSSYSYSVEEYALQSEEPYRTLNKKLTDFLDNGHENALLIIYYGGHGGINKDRNHVWLW
jgi:hypothetical protein